jgi:hypothetical protein
MSDLSEIHKIWAVFREHCPNAFLEYLSADGSVCMHNNLIKITIYLGSYGHFDRFKLGTSSLSIPIGTNENDYELWIRVAIWFKDTTIFDDSWFNLLGNRNVIRSRFTDTKGLISYIESNSDTLPIKILEATQLNIRYKFLGHTFEIMVDASIFTGGGCLFFNGIRICELRAFENSIEHMFNSLFPTNLVRQEKLKKLTDYGN